MKPLFRIRQLAYNLRRKVIQGEKFSGEEAQEKREDFVSILINHIEFGSANKIFGGLNFRSNKKIVQFLDKLPINEKRKLIEDVNIRKENFAPEPKIPVFLEILNDSHRFHFGMNKKPDLRKDNFRWGDALKLLVSNESLTQHITKEKVEVGKRVEEFAEFKSGGKVHVPSKIKNDLEKRADHLLKVYWDAIEKYDFERSYAIHREMMAFRKEVDKYVKNLAPFVREDFSKILPVKKK